MPHSVVPEPIEAVSGPAVVSIGVGLVRLGSKCGYAAVKHSENTRE